MSTPAQIAANRANAARSTGPRTPEGKSRSAQNSRKHGFRATAFPVIRLEDIREVENLRADLVALYQPVNSQELFAIERMALAQQSILRAARLESGLFSIGLDALMNGLHQEYFLNPDTCGGDVRITTEQNRNFLLAEGFVRTAARGNSWNLFLRYQADAERRYRRALEEFERLKSLRPEFASQPDVPPPDPEPADLYHHPRPDPFAPLLPNEPNSAATLINPNNFPDASPNPSEPIGHSAGPRTGWVQRPPVDRATRPIDPPVQIEARNE